MRSPEPATTQIFAIGEQPSRRQQELRAPPTGRDINSGWRLQRPGSGSFMEPGLRKSPDEQTSGFHRRSRSGFSCTTSASVGAQPPAASHGLLSHSGTIHRPPECNGMEPGRCRGVHYHRDRHHRRRARSPRRPRSLREPRHSLNLTIRLLQNRILSPIVGETAADWSRRHGLPFRIFVT